MVRNSSKSYPHSKFQLFPYEKAQWLTPEDSKWMVLLCRTPRKCTGDGFPSLRSGTTCAIKTPCRSTLASSHHIPTFPRETQIRMMLMRCGRAKSSSAKVLTSVRWGRIGRSGDQGHSVAFIELFAALHILATVLLSLFATQQKRREVR